MNLHMETLKQLIEMGFSPMVALVIAGLIVLWGALCGVVIFMWKSVQKERRDRDALRDAWKAELDARLQLSENRHEACEKDRDRLENEMVEMRLEIRRIKHCSAGANCPMRLPA